MNECRRCTATLWHCHGTLVRHDDGSLECTDVVCAGGVEIHDFVVTCEEVLGCCGEAAELIEVSRVA